MSDLQTLRADVREYLERDAADLTDARIASWVNLAEQKHRRTLALSPQLTRTTLVGDGTEFIALPADYTRIRHLKYTAGEPYTLTQVSSDALNEARTGRPMRYAVEFLQLRFDVRPTASDTFELYYYRAFDPLVSDFDSNWLTRFAYELYLYGVLVQSVPWAREEGAVVRDWAGMYAAAVKEVAGDDEASLQTRGRQQVTIEDGYATP